MTEIPVFVKFNRRLEQVPAGSGDAPLVEIFKQLGEEERQRRVLQQQVEQGNFRLACLDYARMLRNNDL